jgi:MoxR-like ATPase
VDYFEDSLQHLLAELERIDLLIAAQVSRAREIFTSDEQFRGLYIPEDEVDGLLAQPLGKPRWALEPARRKVLTSKLDAIRQANERRTEESLRRGVGLRLHRLERLFGLDPFEVDALLVPLAVELDLRYERLYAYLQDDVTRKRPGIELVLNLLSPSMEDKLDRQGRFVGAAPLVRHQLVEVVEDPSQPNPPFLAKYLKVNGRIVQYLLGSDEVDERIRSFARMCEDGVTSGVMPADGDLRGRVGRFMRSGAEAGGAMVYLRGPYGVGRQTVAEAVCRELGARLLVADVDLMARDSDSAWAAAFSLVHREARLQQAAVFWKHYDTLLDDQNNGALRAFVRNLADRPELTFLAGEMPWEPADTLRGIPFARVELTRPTFSERSSLWSAVLDGSGPADEGLDVAVLSSKFKFTGGQIQDAAATAMNLARMRDSDSPRMRSHELYEACRLHSNQKLGELARKITPRYRWNDIVLPADRLDQLREICNHVKYRDRVYGEWGFDRKLSLGKGLSVLFAGPSGTGKTMAAEIIAGELGLEVYKIDLSTVVSKYIGETEKNLARIFGEAETSNAILFFDEADALFGKRSEVKDSHDRYANIETGYLLQRMEEYEGVAILATNFRKNMDEAFVRRLHFAVEFPFPGEADRRRIWESIWPEETPRDPDLDLDFVARQFEISGGNIRNIALAAAFFAADGGGVVSTAHLLHATQREYQKMGKVIAHGAFDGHARSGAARRGAR